MSIEFITILMFFTLLVLMFSGIPIVFALGATAVLFAYFLLGTASLGLIANTCSVMLGNFVLLAIPLFVFMAAILERAGLADALYEMMHKWFGPVRGGLAIGTVLICTIFAAMSGISAAATVTMGVIALPSMLKRNYDKKIVVGCILAGGGLGQLIPPSGMMIVWALWAGESVGQMFIAGIIPGIILSGLFIMYIVIRCYLNPKMGPSLPPGERATWSEKFISLKAIILPALLIVTVLGSMFAGMVTPTEAAGIGALGSLICAAVHRHFTWGNFTQAIYSSIRITCLILWIMIAGAYFSAVFTAIGGQQFVISTIEAIPIGRWGILIMMQIIYLVLGCFMDPNAILMLSVPIFVPIIKSLGFNSLWFGVIFIVNMEMSFLTPPFGMNLFYMKGIAPKNISIGDIYRSIMPFVLLQMIGLIICMVFPQTILWLPNLIMGN